LVTKVRAQATTTSAPAALPKWPAIYDYLKSKSLMTLPPEKAEELASSGEWVIVDVRPKEAFETGHIEGSVSVPLYQALDWSDGQILGKAFRFVAYSFNGVAPIEPNPKFSEQLRELAAAGKGIITVCESGGTMTSSVNFPQGKASRSLQAAYRALRENITDKVAQLERGVYGWYMADLPMEGEYKPDIGRTPMAAAEAKFPVRK